MCCKTDSLNLSMATGIVIYAATAYPLGLTRVVGGAASGSSGHGCFG